MRVTRTQNAATLLYNLLVCGAAGYLGYRFYLHLPLATHAAIVGASAALVAILSAISGQVFGKLDKLLQDSEKYDAVRVKLIYRFVHGVRHRLVIFLFLSATFGVFNTGLALLLPKLQDPASLAARVATAFGYAGVTAIVLFALRLTYTYLSLDRFRLDLFTAIQNENQRERTLVELRPSVLTPFPKGEGGRGGTLPMESVRR